MMRTSDESDTWVVLIPGSYWIFAEIARDGVAGAVA
jgi:hypothetical protein